MINAVSYMPLTHDPIISVLCATLTLIRESTPTPCSPPLPKCPFNPFGISSCPLAYLSLSDLWGCPCSWGHWQLQQMLTGRVFCRMFSHAETETEEDGCRGGGSISIASCRCCTHCDISCTHVTEVNLLFSHPFWSEHWKELCRRCFK